MIFADDSHEPVQGVTPYMDTPQFPPLAATVQVTFGARSRRGRLHPINEDHYAVIRLGRSQETLLTSLPEESIAARFDEYGYAMVVADGLGVPGAGEAASHLAIATLVNLVRHFSKWNLRIDEAIAQEIMARAERFYRHVDSTVVHQRQEGTTDVDQTTLTATFGAGRDLFFAHVGHSRAYLCRRGRLMRLTRDHTFGRHRSTGMPLGPLMDVNAAARDLRHILTQTIGMEGPVGPSIDLERIHLDDDDRVLVCTNGLTDLIDDDRILDVLKSDQSPDDQCQALVGQAMAAGGDDDATALIARYRIPSALK
jgi:protein phosphatase